MIEALTSKLRNVGREPSPILVHELRSLFRMPLFVRFLSLSTGSIGLIVLTIASVALMDRTAPSEIGRVLFDVFFSLVIFVTGVVAPLHAATSITVERESQTYETLVLSGMDPARIALGKLMGTLSAIGLVVVALLPVVGISFLFGGVSPVEVLLGLLLVAALVAPGAAFGVATSARFATTRAAILVTLLATGVVSPFVLGMLFSLSHGLSSGSFGDSGPFESIRWLADHLTDLDSVALGILLPLSVSTLFSWFFVCAAIASLRPAAEDRVSPFKTWSVGLVVFAFTLIAIFALNDSGHDASAIVASSTLTFVSALIVLIFVDDVPLPPRTARGQVSRGYARSGSFFGPGLAGTTRFAALLLVFANVGGIALLVLGHRVGLIGGFGGNNVRIAACWSLATVIIGLFALGVGSVARTVIANGNVVRVLVLLLGFMLQAAPMLVVIAFSPRAFDHVPEHIPPVLLFTPGGVFLSAVAYADGSVLRNPGPFPLIVSGSFYLLAAVALFGALTAKLRRLAREGVARRTELTRMIEARRAAREGAA